MSVNAAQSRSAARPSNNPALARAREKVEAALRANPQRPDAVAVAIADAMQALVQAGFKGAALGTARELVETFQQIRGGISDQARAQKARRQACAT